MRGELKSSKAAPFVSPNVSFQSTEELSSIIVDEVGEETLVYFHLGHGNV